MIAMTPHANDDKKPSKIAIQGVSAELRARLEAIAAPVCAAHGVELVDIRYLREPGGAVLRVLIDVIGSENLPPVAGARVSVEHCTNVSRDLSTALDVHDLFNTSYRLEVGSPGIERPLVKDTDFERFANREVRISTQVPVGDRRKFQGKLLGHEAGWVEIEQDGAKVRIPIDQIVKANVVHKF